MSVPLLFEQGQKALGFHKKYLNLCSEDEGINDRIHFGQTIPLKEQSFFSVTNFTILKNLFPL